MNSGAYRLHISVKKAVTVRIGALGVFRFPAGDYVYTGSAMKNLRQRIERHKSNEKKLHWHIDYLLDCPEAVITKVEVFESNVKNECSINMEFISQNNASIPVRGFGSSDCRTCPAHLVTINNK